ncbi:MAG: hypothetical protein A2015_01410 [Spirochaetes bacterium GWF1_31_7]|nr:MAG: hypothetical protein A2Y30_08000 [Spirochaetes bacterium GWE1_32_154]OHD47861.1 MAG: hypothetical protein A2015_01410 [Spirochaetes bacterium GWF1_31_7]OHD52222.1 MAG: hypothetical protein A2Y29_17645 [Spirochaetes bacterium GWE2_31_10]OHD78888.1 MAG: hypothetical protein A2355_01310 [Spirochaetes bacterium RIFOXYB1_FULL_32_8]
MNEITFFKTIPTESFMTIVNDNINNPDYVLIDVRTPSEFQSGHIKNALLIDFNSSNFNTIIESLDRSKTYMLYCRSGNRSGQAMEIMKNKGFTGIYNMQSGFNEYQNLGYPVEKN